ncbi:MAG: class I SAM-dependent DNA methyltransferase [Phototrophicaceae bacterium]
MTTPLSNAELANKLWQAADTLRGNIDASEYKHVALGLIFLKYISDSFEDVYETLKADEYADEEDPDEYLAENIFFVPDVARWSYIKSRAKDPTIGVLIDNAMRAIESNNSRLKDLLPQDYGREALDKRRLGQLVDEISNVALSSRDDDVLGYVYEYFLGQFASAEGKKGGEFFTATSIVQLLVEMLEPYKGRVYDPCCGSGGMFVQSERFIEEHGGNADQISIYGQESNHTTYKLCRMNLEIRGIDSSNIRYGDTFHSDKHPDLKADYILANPPFNISDWGGQLLEDDSRWWFGVPPANNANFAWIQHIISHLSTDGRAGFVLANGSMSTSTNAEADIRQSLIDADMIDCMVALPSQLFHNTQIPVCLWFVNRNKPEHRKEQVLFIDGRNMGEMLNRTQRDLPASEREIITDAYHAWLTADGDYEDVAGFVKSASLEEIQGHNYILTPGRYVGAPELEDDGEPFPEKMARLTAQLKEQFAESARLEAIIRENLEGLGYGE